MNEDLDAPMRVHLPVMNPCHYCVYNPGPLRGCLLVRDCGVGFFLRRRDYLHYRLSGELPDERRSEQKS